MRECHQPTLTGFFSAHHSFIHSLILTHSLTLSLTHSRTRSLTHSLVLPSSVTAHLRCGARFRGRCQLTREQLSETHTHYYLRLPAASPLTHSLTLNTQSVCQSLSQSLNHSLATQPLTHSLTHSLSLSLSLSLSPHSLTYSVTQVGRDSEEVSPACLHLHRSIAASHPLTQPRSWVERAS